MTLRQRCEVAVGTPDVLSSAALADAGAGGGAGHQCLCGWLGVANSAGTLAGHQRSIGTLACSPIGA